MKNLLFIIFLLSSIPLFSQSRFVINGKTNVLVNGKVVITMTAPNEFYPFKVQKDTVSIRQHSFMFTGTLKYPEQFRIQMIDKNNNHSLSEPFFISPGYHKMTVDKASAPHDSLEVGYGVNLQNDPANDEYIKKFLPLYNQVSKRIEHYEQSIFKCNSIKGHKEKKGCMLAAQAERASIRKSSDNVLLNYTKSDPRSPILPWLLYDGIRYHGYNDCYENVFKEMSAYTPENINIPIRNFLAKQKLKAPGYPFPLTTFVKANVSKNISQNKYILVDFWFSGCGPCIGQFSELKSIYKKYNKRGFEIIAVSIDKKEAIAKYKKIIQANSYPWVQVLDLNGMRTKTMDVNAFPSSFLLDSHWKIVTTRINPDILDSFLEDHLL